MLNEFELEISYNNAFIDSIIESKFDISQIEKNLLSDFYKKTSVIKCSKSGIEKIGQLAINLAEYEGLYAHALSVRKRLGD